MRTPFRALRFSATVLFCFAPLADAQSVRTFSDEPYVVTKALTTVSMNMDGTGKRVITFAVRVQSQAALQQFSVASISYASKAEKAEFVYVRVTHSDGTTQETDVAQTMEQPAPVTQQAPFYSDLEVKQLPVKSMRVGDTLEWQAKFTVEHPEAPGQIWGQDSFIRGAICLDETYELEVPSSVHLVVWTNPRFKESLLESTDAGMHTYRWHHTELTPTVGAEADAFRKAEETRRRTAEEELDYTKGELPSLAWSSFADWAAVGAWYRTLSADRMAPDPAIRAKVAELTAGKSTDLEKAQAVYNYVSGHIRYIGVAFGIGRYQPHTAAEILANQYGDCKDKHTLLASMLSVLNLRADPVLVGAGIRFNSPVPTPAAFNHLITRIDLNGTQVWLDSTAEVGPWGALLQPIRDHEALAIPAASPAVVVKTPADLPYAAFSTSKVVGTLDKDLTSDSTMTLTYRDDDEFAVRSVLRSVSPSNYGQFVQQMMAGMGFGGTTSEPSFEHTDDTSQPIQLSFHYHRVKEKDWGENRITAAFQPISLPAFTEERPAVIAIQLGAVRTETSTVEMKLPPDWHAQLPEAVHAHAAFAKCDVTYRVENGTIFAERRLAILQSKVPVEDAKKYQAWYDEAGASGYPYIQLMPPIKQVTTGNLPAPTVPRSSTAHGPQPSNPDAARLVRQAFVSAHAMDLDTARASLDEAFKLNPTEIGLWANYAMVAQLLGKQNEAIEDAMRELSYHPDEFGLYRSVSQNQLFVHDTEGSIATLRAWVNAAPQSVEAALALANQLQSSNRYADTLAAAQDAISRIGSPSSDLIPLRILAAKAQLGIGHAQEAVAAILPIEDQVSSPNLANQLNSIFAEAHSHLAEATTRQAAAIEATETETQGWTGTEDIKIISEKEALLASEWDTMAWLYHQQEKYKEAYDYEIAARHLSSGWEINGHLATITSALHDSKKYASFNSASDQSYRTFPLGPSNGRKGTAGFTLLIANGKVLDAISQDPHTGAPNKLEDVDELVKSVDLHSLFYPGSRAHLVRPAFVNCIEQSCELVFVPLRPSSN